MLQVWNAVIKTLVDEEDTDKALVLIERVAFTGQLIDLPAFAWTEVGSVLRKMRRKNLLTVQEADDLWLEFRHFQGIEYLSDDMIMDRAWKISRHFDMPTLYDTSFLAVAEVVAERTGEICEYWTEGEKLINQLNGRREYIRWLKNFPL